MENNYSLLKTSMHERYTFLMAEIRINEVRKSFSGVPVLKGVSLDIRDGEFFFILGPSGCGKSTLLRIIAGLEEAESGDISIDGRSMRGIPPHLRGIGMVFQSYALWPHMTVEQNISFGLEVQKLSQNERRSRIQEALNLVQLSSLAGRYPSQLSGGQQQRVALARALALRPKVLLLDEPLSNLDARLRDDIRRELLSLHQQLGTTMIYVTHDQEDALTLAARIALLEHGAVVQIGSPHEIYEHPVNSFAARFLGDANLIPCRVIPSDSAGGLITAETPLAPGRHLKAPKGTASLTAGDAILCIRPEQLSIHPLQDKEEYPNHEHLDGQVTRIVYKGALTEIEVSVGGYPLSSRILSSIDIGVRAGDTVRVKWNRNSGSIIH